MKRFASLFAALFVLAFATDATAGARIVTPRLIPDLGGALTCNVVNASDKKEVVVELTIYRATGVAVTISTVYTVLPNGSASIGSSDDFARHCVVVVKKGGKKNVRVSLATSALGNVTAAVSGF